MLSLTLDGLSDSLVVDLESYQNSSLCPSSSGISTISITTRLNGMAEVVPSALLELQPGDVLESPVQIPSNIQIVVESDGNNLDPIPEAPTQATELIPESTGEPLRSVWELQSN